MSIAPYKIFKFEIKNANGELLPDMLIKISNRTELVIAEHYTDAKGIAVLPLNNSFKDVTLVNYSIIDGKLKYQTRTKTVIIASVSYYEMIEMNIMFTITIYTQDIKSKLGLSGIDINCTKSGVQIFS